MTCQCPNCVNETEVLIERLDKRLFMATMEDFPFVTAIAKTRKGAGDRLMDFYEAAICGNN